MPERQSPATVKRRLRRELRALRERAKLSQGEVVDRFRWSLSKLIRIENGSVGVSVPDVMALTTLYEATAEDRDRLIALAVAAKESRWWDEHRHVVPPHLQQFLGFEADATRIRLFQPMVVPGLLQIDEYIRSVGTASLQPTKDSEEDALVQVRLKRKQHVLFRDRPPEYVALIDESVLHRQVGSQEVMTQQLTHLCQLVTEDRILLGILPFTKGAHFGVTGAFHLMEFNGNVDDTIVYIETAHNTIVVQDKPDLIAMYGERFEAMMDASVRGSDAVDFIEKHLATGK